MVLLLWRVNMGKRIEIDISNLFKNDISPTAMAHFIGVSYGTYNRYQQNRTVPQSENTKAIIDNIIEKLK